MPALTLGIQIAVRMAALSVRRKHRCELGLWSQSESSGRGLGMRHGDRAVDPLRTEARAVKSCTMASSGMQTDHHSGICKRDTHSCLLPVLGQNCVKANLTVQNLYS